MATTEQIIRECMSQSGSRLDFWITFIQSARIARMLELGVYRGDFAEKILTQCKSIKTYYMLDPWRHLDGWNKPANKEDDIFEGFLSETKSKTDFAAGKRVILRGKTTEMIDKIGDGALDLAYIDGDHTLKGIAIDLIRVFPKIRDGGWIGGDDFSRTIWQHDTSFEPTLVFPFAIYFAEAVNARIYAVRDSQFVIEKNKKHPFEFIDLTGSYDSTGLRDQFKPGTVLTLRLKELFSFASKAGGRAQR